MQKTKVVICPYCGETQPADERCRACGGLFEALSRQATHNAMGPWFVRDPERPFSPGRSYETLVSQIERGTIDKYTILRGPTTKQFWTIAKHVPGVAHLLGYCHDCHVSVDAGDHGCHACGVPFGAYLDRNYLGLPEIRPLPWEAGGEGQDRSQFAGPPGWTPPSAGGRLSSFATDEELRGQTASAIGPASEFAAADAAPRTEPLAQPAAEPARVQPSEQDITNSSVVQAMRRKLAAQRRTIRSLWIALGIVGLLAILEGVALLGQPKANPGTPADETSAASPAAGEPLGRVEEPLTNSNPARSGDADRAIQGDSPPAAADAAPPVDPALIAERVEALVAAADEKTAAANDDTIDLGARMSTVSEAVAMLEQAEAMATPARREAIIERLATLRRLQELLELKSFYP